MHPMRKPATVERPAGGRVAYAAPMDWPSIVKGIRENCADSSAEFKDRYRNGVVVFLRRQLGSVGLSQLADETLNGALREIGAGRLATPADLVHFLRNVLERELLIRNLDPARSLVALASATDHGRLSREAGFIHLALSEFTEPEQRALRGYYDGDLTAEQAAAVAGLAGDGFVKLRERLYEAVRAAGLRKAPKMEKARAMAASSGGVG